MGNLIRKLGPDRIFSILTLGFVFLTFIALFVIRI